jgi:membrane protease YdiL (CAAX protease family)
MVIAAPWYASLYMFPRLLQALAAGGTGLRLLTYNRIIVQGWVLCFLLLSHWFLRDRFFGDVGLTLDWRFSLWLGLGLAAAAGLGLHLYNSHLLSTGEGRDYLRGELKKFSLFLPHTLAERNRFFLVGITAGVWEELLFRGFLIWYFGNFMGLWPAVLLSSLLFGMAHMYQGWKGMLRTGVAGLVFAGLYVLTGSLWVPMLLHAAVDVLAGRVVFEVFQTPQPEPEAI